MFARLINLKVFLISREAFFFIVMEEDVVEDFSTEGRRGHLAALVNQDDTGRLGTALTLTAESPG